MRHDWLEDVQTNTALATDDTKYIVHEIVITSAYMFNMLHYV